MTTALGRWTLALDGGEPPSRASIGGKAWSVAHMRSLGLPVPPAFVVTTAACAEALAVGGLPQGLEAELDSGLAWLEQASGRRFGAGPSPLLVSVRSGAAISMPGMMDTVLDLGIDASTEYALAVESGAPAFARDTHRRFLEMYASVVLKRTPPELDPAAEPDTWYDALRGAGAEFPAAPREQLSAAVAAVFASWNSRRARRYREHNGIADRPGTAVTVQAMVFGNLDAHSGSGVLFSRNPLTGDTQVYGEYLARAQGEDVVSGRCTPQPLTALRDDQPDVWEALVDAAKRLESANGDVQDIEFTVERGRLFLLQARAAKRAPRAALRIAVDLVREGVIDEDEALRRVSPEQLRSLLAPRLDPAQADPEPILVGEAAGPGVGIGVVVAGADEAEARARLEPVVLATPTTSPSALHGMIAAQAVITEQGGSTCHAAVVSRALGRACVVGCGAGTTAALVGRRVTVDGTRGRIYDGALPLAVPDERADPLCLALAGWAAARSPLQILRLDDAPTDGLLQLDGVAGADDPQCIGIALNAALDDHEAVRGAVGGAIASDAGVRAALGAGLQFIVAEPTLPALVAAARASLQQDVQTEVPVK